MNDCAETTVAGWRPFPRILVAIPMAAVLAVHVLPLTVPSTAIGQRFPVGFSRPSRSWSSPRQPPHPAVARVIVAERGAVSQGSGTLVDVYGDYGLVVTNWHVVRDAAGEVKVLFPGGFQSAARIVKVDRDWDLAVLAVWRPPVEPMPLAALAPRLGEPLTIAGYGHGDYRAAQGRCTQYVAPGANLPYEMVEVNVSAREGDSGGPMINRQGELAGVLFGSDRHSTSGSYVGRVRRFLASISRDLRSAAEPEERSTPGKVTHPAQVVKVPPRASVPDGRRDVSLAPLPSRSTPSLPPQPAWTSAPQPEMETHEEPQVISWTELVGESPWEQAKSALAAIGVLALVILLVRTVHSRGSRS